MSEPLTHPPSRAWQLTELPNALSNAGEHERLAERLSDLNIFEIFAEDTFRMRELMMYWQGIEDTHDPVALYSVKLQEEEDSAIGSDNDVDKLKVSAPPVTPTAALAVSCRRCRSGAIEASAPALLAARRRVR